MGNTNTGSPSSWLSCSPLPALGSRNEPYIYAQRSRTSPPGSPLDREGGSSSSTTTVTRLSQSDRSPTWGPYSYLIPTSQAGNSANNVRRGTGHNPVNTLSALSPSPVSADQQNLTDENGYVPMGHWPRPLDRAIWERQLATTGISRNYGGNIFLSSNQSANIADGLSTSLWLTNLPPDCTHRMLLGAIRRCGKIYATVINPPEYPVRNQPHRGNHLTSASKLVFFDRAGVERLIAQSQAGQFSVEGYVPRLRMNRIRSAPREPSGQCRVLHIDGPSHIVNERFLNTFFQTKFIYELDEVITLRVRNGFTRQEWRFGSYRCQAESARQSIAREKARRNLSDAERIAWSQVQVHFGVDPCA
ncbi:hypothetical protein GGS26DRAFT_509804 [Hypomontagnella submonticulosa]|nr:hypothetical protein GGS26DRAFT_509804 [Hypomontagnella submonticulosa]